MIHAAQFYSFLESILKGAYIEEVKVTARPTGSEFVDPKLQHLRTLVKVEMWLYVEQVPDVALARD